MGKLLSRFVVYALFFLVFGYLGGLFGSGPTPSPEMAAREQAKQNRLEQIRAESQNRYHFSRLWGESQDFYVRTVYAIENLYIYVSDAPSDKNTAFSVFNAVLKDYPEFFWVLPEVEFVTKMVGNSPSGYRLDLHYIDERNKESIAAKQVEIDQKVQAIIDELTDIESPYEQARKAYEYLIKHSEYDESYDDQSMYSLLVRGRAVCAGYARTYQYILNKLGIQATYITGRLKDDDSYQRSNLWAPYSLFNRSNHAWNRVKIGDEWMHVDVTSGGVFSNGNTVGYQFFMVSDEDLKKTHIVND